jgi:hypothetical protein
LKIALNRRQRKETPTNILAKHGFEDCKNHSLLTMRSIPTERISARRTLKEHRLANLHYQNNIVLKILGLAIKKIESNVMIIASKDNKLFLKINTPTAKI